MHIDCCLCLDMIGILSHPLHLSLGIVVVIAKSWLRFHVCAQSTGLRQLFHADLVQTALKVCKIVSERHFQIELRTVTEVVSLSLSFERSWNQLLIPKFCLTVARHSTASSLVITPASSRAPSSSRITVLRLSAIPYTQHLLLSLCVSLCQKKSLLVFGR